MEIKVQNPNRVDELKKRYLRYVGKQQAADYARRLDEFANRCTIHHSFHGIMCNPKNNSWWPW